MQILLALIFGAVYGGVLHFLMPGRTSRGAALAPMIGAVAGGATWLALTWAGLVTTDAWLWIISLAVPVAVVPVVLTVLTRTRAFRYAQERIRLKIA